MGGGGPSQTTSTTTSSPWAPAAKFDRQYLGDIWNYLTGTGTQPNIMGNPFPNQGIAGFTPDEMAAFGAVDAANPSVSGVTTAADAQLAATLGGQYLNPSSNPYLQDTYNAAAQSMGNQFKYDTAPSTMGAFASAGGYGDSAFNDAMAQQDFSFGNNLAALGADIFGGNYQQERSNMMNAMNMVPSVAQASYIPAEAQLGIGQMQQSQGQNVLNTNYQNAYNSAMFPFQALQMLGSSLTSMGSQGGTSISMQPFMGAGKGL